MGVSSPPGRLVVTVTDPIGDGSLSALARRSNYLEDWTGPGVQLRLPRFTNSCSALLSQGRWRWWCEGDSHLR
jgi:hypothetical protein